MRYRFLLTNRDGASGSFEWSCESDSKAREMAASIVRDVTFIIDVTIYRLLTDDSCGPISYIGTCNREDL